MQQVANAARQLVDLFCKRKPTLYNSTGVVWKRCNTSTHTVWVCAGVPGTLVISS